MVKKNFTEGKIFTPMLLFVLPIMLTNVLQTLYNIADNVVVGKFSGDPLALAAVGTSGSLSALFLNIVVGLSIGSSVTISHAFGAKKYDEVSKSVHTALSFGGIFGTVLAIFAIIFAEDMLVLTGTSPEILGRATLYLRIIFAALPATAIYNFSAAALRAVGDSKTSLYILTASGLLNIVLNIVFVTAFDMSVDGVALATAISKYASAIAVVAVLLKRRGECYALSFGKLRISMPVLKKMLRFGLPNSIQNSMFSISNVLITGAINSLPTYVLSARTIATNLNNLANNASSSYMNAMITFAGQNFGAKKYQRIKKSLLICLLQSITVTLFLGVAGFLFIEPISSLYIASNDPLRLLIIEEARSIGFVTLPLYFISSIMNAVSGALRGMGYSLPPMIASLIGTCGFRTLWIYTAFAHFPSLHSAQGLYISYPISWALVIIGLVPILAIALKRLSRTDSDNVLKECEVK
ncbi:MAG: MATE family efflux transporter [Clostridia bacterium]|nr:MATE family efflux transporter [Clostridia bacterium]